MTSKIIKAQITTRDVKGHVRHYSEKDINLEKVAVALGITSGLETKKKTTPKKTKD